MARRLKWTFWLKKTVFFIFFPLGVFGHNREEDGVARIAVPQKKQKTNRLLAFVAAARCTMTAPFPQH